MKNGISNVIALAIMISGLPGQDIGPLTNVAATAFDENGIAVASFNGYVTTGNPRDNTLGTPTVFKTEQELLTGFQQFLVKQQKQAIEGNIPEILFVHRSKADTLLKRMVDLQVITDNQAKLMRKQVKDVTGEVAKKSNCSTKISIADYASTRGLQGASSLQSELMQLHQVFVNINPLKQATQGQSKPGQKIAATA